LGAPGCQDTPGSRQGERLITAPPPLKLTHPPSSLKLKQRGPYLTYSTISPYPLLLTHPKVATYFSLSWHSRETSETPLTNATREGCPSLEITHDNANYKASVKLLERLADPEFVGGLLMKITAILVVYGVDHGVMHAFSHTSAPNPKRRTANNT